MHKCIANLKEECKRRNIDCSKCPDAAPSQGVEAGIFDSINWQAVTSEVLQFVILLLTKAIPTVAPGPVSPLPPSQPTVTKGSSSKLPS